MAELPPPVDLSPIPPSTTTILNIPTNTITTPVVVPAPPPLILPSSTAPDTSHTTNTTVFKTKNNTNHLIQQQQQQSLAPKRQRRPSVRLGEIGYDSSNHQQRRRPKTWKFHKHPTFATKSSKVRPLTNLVVNAESGTIESDDNLDFNRASKSKCKGSVKRVRTNWTTTNNEVEFRDFEQEQDNSESPLNNSVDIDNVGVDEYWTPVRTNRVSESLDDRNDRICGGGGTSSNDGVRDWLSGLGLAKYAPMFEIHEVDDQVLPILTLEDLKDIGIHAVGSRRKMYTSILKLGKGFS